MIFLYTDFGLDGPYVGQLHSVLAEQAPTERIIDLMHDAPRFQPATAGCLLSALALHFPPASICLAVIDPGVGSERRPVVVKADEHWFVGPDNGLFDHLGHRFNTVEWFEIIWRPARLSASFHGRDLFAPVAAAIANGQAEDKLAPIGPAELAAELSEVIYIDGYGNAMTGLNADRLPTEATLVVGGQTLRQAGTFSHVPTGQGFWYKNSLGLVEIAVNQGQAAAMLALRIGDPVEVRQGR